MGLTRRSAVFLAALLILSPFSLLGCSDVQIQIGETKPFPAKLVAVYPYRLQYDAPAYKSFELAMDEVEVVLAQKQLAVLGPDEFKIFPSDGPEGGIFAATNVAGALPVLGLLPDNVVALRGWAERREQKFSSVRYDAQGKPAGQRRDVQVTMIAHLELLGPRGSNPLAEAKVEFQVNPFADHPLYDDSPELRKEVRRLTEQLLDKANSVLVTEPQPSNPGFEYLYNPRNAETFSLPNRPPYEKELAAMDPISRDAAVTALLLYFNPELPPSRAEQLQMLPTGLLVTSVTSQLVAMDGLSPNDLIVEVERTPVAGPQTLLRWMARKAPGVPVQLVVLRGRSRLNLNVPSPAR